MLNLKKDFLQRPFRFIAKLRGRERVGRFGKIALKHV